MLHGTVGRTECRKSVFLAHVFRDFESAQCFDLPLRRAGPYRIRSPDYVIGAETFDKLAHHRGTQARLRDGALRKDLPKVAVDILHTVLLRNLGKIRYPVDASGLIELVHADLVCAARKAES